MQFINFKNHNLQPITALSDQLWTFYGYGYIFEADVERLKSHYANNTPLARALKGLDMVSNARPEIKLIIN